MCEEIWRGASGVAFVGCVGGVHLVVAAFGRACGRAFDGVLGMAHLHDPGVGCLLCISVEKRCASMGSSLESVAHYVSACRHAQWVRVGACLALCSSLGSK